MYFLKKTINREREGTEGIKMGFIPQQRAVLLASGPRYVFYVVWDLRLSWPPRVWSRLACGPRGALSVAHRCQFRLPRWWRQLIGLKHRFTCTRLKRHHRAKFSNCLRVLNPFQPKLILVHTTVTGTCRQAYKTCKNWPLCSYVGWCQHSQPNAEKSAQCAKMTTGATGKRHAY